MAKSDSNTPAASEPQQSLGFAKVQDPNGPDQLDANNTGRVGDAREYAVGASSVQVNEGTQAGQVAAETVYVDLAGNRVSGADAGSDGFRGSILVAKGDVISPAVAAQLKG